VAGKKVLVIGGDSAGIQSALDLANAGNEVYLVDRAPGMGGERLLPAGGTLEQSGFIPSLWPEAKAHKNIRIFSNAVFEDIQKENGGFRLKIRKAALRVIEEKCDNCGECIKVCPIHLRDDFNNGLCLRTAVDFFSPESKTYSVIKERPVCEETCPVHLDIRGYVGLIADGKFREALALIREKLPFPGTIGRICPHPCEEACNRGQQDKALCIRDLKRFVADADAEEIIPKIQPNGTKVAVIGAGPAGLTCAHDLAVKGYGVTVFEALPVAGGMLAVGIPRYRLPREILNREIDFVKKLGVDIKTDTRIGKDLAFDELFKQGYKAVFIAVGSHKDQKLRVAGEDAPGVVSGVDFLRDIALGRDVKVGSRVGIVGGGNVAMDAARSSLRLGAQEVYIIYRRTRDEMPASSEEIDAALHEGIKFEYLVAPVEVVVKNNSVAGMKCIRMQLGEPDASGRRRPVPVEGSEFVLELDMVVLAIGQASDLSFLPEDGSVAVTKWGTVIADAKTCATNRANVYAGGDCVSGPWIAIGAIAAGKEAARAIDAQCKGA
jgi:NADPH-dependent glutamate synthase beta subunit-like oxidoreductase